MAQLDTAEVVVLADLAIFALAAAALLGSPGPGVTALMAVGRLRGGVGALRYYLWMQIGISIAAALCAAGLGAFVTAYPALYSILLAGSIAYLLWLAWSIATAPLGSTIDEDRTGGAFTSAGAFMLGFANPQVYLVFAVLFGTFTIVAPTHGLIDNSIKWLAGVVITATVYLAWLFAGVVLGNIGLSPRAERTMNVCMGVAILIACGFTL